MRHPSKHRGVGVALLPSLIWIALACGADDEPEGPPEIRYGYDLCSHCSMIIDAPDHAAVARSRDGREARFDDLSGLRSFLRTADGSWTAWVHTGAGWLPAERAWYLRDPEVVTPMGSGLVAFADRESALQAGSDPDSLRSWSQFLDAATSTSTSWTTRPEKEEPS